GDLPGRLYSAIDSLTGEFLGRVQAGQENSINILCGVGGEDGSAPLTLNDVFGAPLELRDPADARFIVLGSLEGVVQLEALANRGLLGNSETFAFNIATIEIDGQQRTVIQVLQVENSDEDNNGVIDATSLSNIDSASLREDL